MILQAAALGAGDSVMRGGGGGDIRHCDLFGKCVADRSGDRLQMDDASETSKCAEQSGIGKRAADMLERELGCRHGQDVARGQLPGNAVEMKISQAAIAVDE